MSQEEIQRLSAEEAELMEKIQKLRAEKTRLVAIERQKAEDEEKRRLLAREILVKVMAIRSGVLVVHAEYRPDLTELWQGIPGRTWNAYQKANQIPIKEWPETAEKLSQLPRLAIEWDPEVEKEYLWHISAPPWEISVESRRGGLNFIARPGPGSSPYVVTSKISSCNWNWEEKCGVIPHSEGWRIWGALKEVEGVVYTDEARDLILQQIEARAALDKIAKKDETDNAQVLELLGDWRDVYGFKARPFQGVGIEYMLAASGQMLLSDQTGLGKTCQTIGFAEIQRRSNPKFITVCAVKAANIPNWIREIRALTGCEPVVCTNKDKDRAEASIALHVLRGSKPYFLISHDTLGTYIKHEENGKEERTYYWQELFGGGGVDYLIVDEAHSIKNPQTNRFRGMKPLATKIPHRVLATATPILNRTGEFWTLLYMIDPVMFSSYEKFVQTYTLDGKIPKNVEELHELLRPIFLRRKKSDVLKDLPPINRVELIHTLSGQAQADYDLAMQGLYRILKEFNPSNQAGDTVSINHVLAQFTRLKQICAVDKIESTTELAQDLIDQQNGDGDGKVLIFSQFKGVAANIARALGSEAVCTVYATGPDTWTSMNSTERDRLFEDARRDSRVKYIVTTGAAKEGHNLEFCNWVIFNDAFWEPASHEQCEGRAYGRLANPHPIDSFYNRADTHVEERIYELLIQKMEIIDATVDSVEMTRDVSGSILMDLIREIKDSMYS